MQKSLEIIVNMFWQSQSVFMSTAELLYWVDTPCYAKDHRPHNIVWSNNVYMSVDCQDKGSIGIVLLTSVHSFSVTDHAVYYININDNFNSFAKWISSILILLYL